MHEHDHAGINPAMVERGRQTLHDDQSYFLMAETFRALADSTRVKIVGCLLEQELCTADLAAILHYSESAVSQHLRVLRQLRLVKQRREGKMVFYSLDDDHVRVLVLVCLNHIRHGATPDPSVAPILAVLEEER